MNIRQRLAAVIDDSRDAVGQEAAKAYLMNITTAESLEFEPGAELSDDSWMEYINEDCMTNTDDPSCPTSLSPYEMIKKPFLQMTSSQTEADPCCSASSPQITKSVSPGKDTPAALCESCRELKKYRKRGKLEYNSLETVVQTLPRSNLLECLDTWIF